jgi:hypothetical protein
MMDFVFLTAGTIHFETGNAGEKSFDLLNHLGCKPLDRATAEELLYFVSQRLGLDFLAVALGRFHAEILRKFNSTDQLTATRGSCRLAELRPSKIKKKI